MERVRSSALWVRGLSCTYFLDTINLYHFIKIYKKSKSTTQYNESSF